MIWAKPTNTSVTIIPTTGYCISVLIRVSSIFYVSTTHHLKDTSRTQDNPMPVIPTPQSTNLWIATGRGNMGDKGSAAFESHCLQVGSAFDSYPARTKPNNERRPTDLPSATPPMI